MGKSYLYFLKQMAAKGLNKPQITQDLEKLGFPSESIEITLKHWGQKNQEISQNLLKDVIRMNRLVNFDW
eukprot:CAMPEP_0114973988 /NCGR_PEP_ID=MMETSP0216-20121206/1273_1 /TAXON_ID=223996 /ORGANISM="Protocruzia adherens, Strain Boccale" /LENGTH=69 /DNA_ID=CAMNT_0002334567 /DNA_START=202 /DNA_END=408 /DNA_ORIENTATION=-